MSPASKRLGGRIASVEQHLRVRAARAIGSWLASSLVLVLLVAWFAAGPEGWTQGSDVPALLDALLIVTAGGAYYLYRRLAQRWFAVTPLAGVVERAAGLRPGVVRGSMELAKDLPQGVSAALANQAAARAVADLERHGSPELSGELGIRMSLWTRRGLGALVPLAVLVIGIAVATPARSWDAWATLSRPLGMMLDPVLPPMVVSPGTVEVLRGSDVQFTVEAPGRTGLVLAWQAAGDIARSEPLELMADRASYVFRAVTASIEYHIESVEGGASETYRIVPIDPLFVSDLIVGVIYPPHTGLAPDEYRGDPPPLRLPVGSSLTFEGRVSRPLSGAELTDSSGTAVVTLQTEGASFSGAWSPLRSGIFDWSFADGEGNPAEIQPEPLMLTLVPDSAPRIAIPFPGQDTVMPLSLQQPLILEAGDDYGLLRVELVAYRVTAFGERLEPEEQGVDLGGSRAALARPMLDLRSWSLMPGDTVRYFARAVDNSPAGQTTTTREFVLRMPVAAELQRAAEEQLEGVAERLEELAAEAARQAEENRDLAREAAARLPNEEPRAGDEAASPDFEERQELERALENQDALNTEVDSLSTELEELQRMMEEAGQADPELTKDLEELQRLLEQMNDGDLQERMDELAEALSAEDLKRANEALDQLSQEQENFRDRLEETLERFRRAAVEQDFRATTSEAEELARQERALADAMREEDNPELRARQQSELGERADELQVRMEGLQERLSEIDEEDAAAGVEQAGESMRKAREKMQQAQQQASDGQNAEAGEEADDAAEQLEQVAQELEDAQNQMAQQQAEAAQAALRQTADDALALARRQAELRESMRGASQEQIADMRSDEASLLQGVENMAQNLQEATDGAMEGGQELSAQMGRAMESLSGTIEAMESRRGATPSPYAQSEAAVGDLNQLALMAIAGAESMGQGQSQSGEDMSEQLEQLAQEQGELMNQAAQLQPMQLGEQAMAQQLQEMAQGQESIASDLGDLADDPGSEEALGDLEELAVQAAMLAEQMAQGRLTPEMVREQERLFHRLLDAGRSLEREEFSNDRESEVAGVFDREGVVPLTPDQLGALRFELPSAEQLQRLSPAVRQLVLQYFERLNGVGAGGGGPS